MARPVFVILAIAGLGASLMGASPATAAALPPGDTLYVLSCALGSPAALFEVSPETAMTTPIGSGTGDLADCPGGSAHDPTTDESYYLPQRLGSAALSTIDVHTGLGTRLAGGSAGGTALAIGPTGKAYTNAPNGDLYSIDLATGATALLGPLVDLDAMAIDPSTGLLYGIDFGQGAVYQIDVEAPVATLIGNVRSADLDADGRVGVRAFQIDRSGRWWYLIHDVSTPLGQVEPAQLFGSARPSGDTPTERVGVVDVREDVSFGYPSTLLLTSPFTPPPPLPPRAADPPLPATGPDELGRAATAAVWLIVLGGILRARRARGKASAAL